MKILYVSVFCSQKKIDSLFVNTNKDPGFAVQKFNRLFAQGFILNDCVVETVSSLPINRSIHKKLFWKRETEIIDNICFNYICFVNLPIFRHLFLFFGSFFKTFSWILNNKNDQNVIVCDVLNTTATMASVLAAKLLNVKTIGIVTDIPGMQPISSENTFFKKNLVSLICLVQLYFLNSYSSYVLLTEQMSEKIDVRKKSYVVIEGLVDYNLKDIDIDVPFKSSPIRKIVYAGSLCECYGIKKLIDAFIQVKNSDLRLLIYGSGDVVKDMDKYMKLDNRIIYYGVAPNTEIIKVLHSAILLINPRPTNELYTKYSFPSKNMEYMVSGTPVLTTKLAGMPNEYYEYVYLFDDETEEGFVNSLSTILSLSDGELIENGKKAKEFVLNYKNNLIQTLKVINMINVS